MYHSVYQSEKSLLPSKDFLSLDWRGPMCIVPLGPSLHVFWDEFLMTSVSHD